MAQALWRDSESSISVEAQRLRDDLPLRALEIMNFNGTFQQEADALRLCGAPGFSQTLRTRREITCPSIAEVGSVFCRFCASELRA